MENGMEIAAFAWNHRPQQPEKNTGPGYPRPNCGSDDDQRECFLILTCVQYIGIAIPGKCLVHIRIFMRSILLQSSSC